MTLDPEICWRAWTARDARFVGRFVMGVTSTHIYCRPGCPARLPARRNVRFYATPAAAEAAGFRACLRCRPDRAPGAPGAAGTAATVSRALRLIDDGTLNDGSLESLAERLGVTSRWLRELFERHVGAAPLEVARTRQAHLARRLIEETALPVEDVAAATCRSNSSRSQRLVTPSRALNVSSEPSASAPSSISRSARATVAAVPAAAGAPGARSGRQRRHARNPAASAAAGVA